MNNEKIKIGFYAGESRYKKGIVNYLISLRHIEPELYAEIIVPEECFDDEGEFIDSDAENYGYEELKAEIIEQAIEEGIKPEQLEFC